MNQHTHPTARPVVARLSPAGRAPRPSGLFRTAARRGLVNLAVLAAVFSPLVSQAHAQTNPYLGAPAIRTYNLTQVMTAAGLIDVAQGDVVTVQLPQEIDSYVLAHQDSFKVELDKDTAYISALANNGRSTLIMRMTDGVLVRFVLNATKSGAAGKGIIVQDNRAAGNFAKSVPVSVSAASSQAAAAAVAAAATTPITATSPLLAASQTNAPSASDTLDAALAKLKAYQAKTISATLIALPATREVEVTFTNTGKTDVALMGTDAHLWIDDEPAAVSAPNVTVKPSQSTKVLLRLSQDVTLEQGLRLSWVANDGVRVTLVEVQQ